MLAGAGGLVVVVGAGIGTLVSEIAATRAVIGVEPSTALARTALNMGRPVILGSGDQLPFPGRSVGVTVAERVLQHVHDQEAVLAECARVVTADGLILVADLVDLGRRLCEWRAAAGVVRPDAKARTAAWAAESGWSAHAETFWCRTGSYADARALTNFPQWAGLAGAAGADVSAYDVESWEASWEQVAASGCAFTFEWPIVVTAMRRQGH